MSNRKEELIQYMDMLKSLLEHDYNCQRELNEALKELHGLMLPKQERMTIAVFEKDFDGVVKSIEVFINLLGNGFKKSRNDKDDFILTYEKITVKVFKFAENPSLYRGMTADYVIDNTKNKDFNKIVQIPNKPKK